MRTGTQMKYVSKADGCPARERGAKIVPLLDTDSSRDSPHTKS